MRAVLLVLILAVVVIIGAIATGFLDISQVRGAQAPDIDVSRNGVTATGGQAPSFDVETGSVGVGTRDARSARVPHLLGSLGHDQGRGVPEALAVRRGAAGAVNGGRRQFADHSNSGVHLRITRRPARPDPR